MENLFRHRDRPYYALDYYFKDTYGEKIYKIAIDGGFTCPTRDGSKDTRGCIFCSASGSGDFSVKKSSYPDINSQIERGISLFRGKQIGTKYVAYFQAFTNTYASPSYCQTLYENALSHPNIVGISIATRPDCMGEEIIKVLVTCKKKFPDKFIWVELGLQTIHESSIQYIRRNYETKIVPPLIRVLRSYDIPVILHVILGLPGETKSMMLETISFVNQMKVFGVKLQLLHVIKDTDLAYDYEKGLFEVFRKEEYISVLSEMISQLSPKIVLHRVTGDGPKDLTIAPLWSLNKLDVLNSLHKYLKTHELYQGKFYQE